MGDAAKKPQFLKLRSTGDLYNRRSFKVGTQDEPNLTYGHVASVMALNNDQKSGRY